jgi:hypothetical protein
MILKKGMGILLLLFLSERGYAACFYIAQTQNSYVVMGQGYGVNYFYLWNSSLSTESITYVTFSFSSSIYKVFGWASANYTWNCNITESADYSQISCTYNQGIPVNGYELLRYM